MLAKLVCRADLSLRLGNVVFAEHGVKAVFKFGAASLQNLPELVRAEFLDEFVGVLGTL